MIASQMVKLDCRPEVKPVVEIQRESSDAKTRRRLIQRGRACVSNIIKNYLKRLSPLYPAFVE